VRAAAWGEGVGGHGWLHRHPPCVALLARSRPGRLAVSTSVQAKEPLQEPCSPPSGRPQDPARPLLLIDIDGVISLFGFPLTERPEGAFHSIDGIPHLLSTAAARHLLDLVSVFELAWCSGWEEKANEYLPHLLGLPQMPFLSFERDMRAMGGAGSDTDGAAGGGGTRAHWKLDAIDAFAGAERPLAWIDDAFNDACHEWAGERTGPTLLVQTDPPTGLTEREAALLREWVIRQPAQARRPAAAGLRAAARSA
jgi:hypothetical protein